MATSETQSKTHDSHTKETNIQNEKGGELNKGISFVFCAQNKTHSMTLDSLALSSIQT